MSYNRKRSETTRFDTGHGAIYITIAWDDAGEINEVFMTTGKTGSCERGGIEGVARLVAMCKQNGVPTIEIIETLRGITCHPVWYEGKQIGSAPDALAHLLEEYDGVQVQGDSPEVQGPSV